MKNYSKFKTGLVIVKLGIFGFLMVAAGSANAVCVSIDKYVATNGRKIYLFGDAHIGSRDGVQKEQDAFIAVAKERGAYCIVEDIHDYKGDNYHIGQCIDDTFYHKMFDWSDALKQPESALLGITGACAAGTVACFNAEWRQFEHSIALLTHLFADSGYLKESITLANCQAIDNIVDEVRGYRDEGVNYKRCLRYFNKKGISGSMAALLDNDRTDFTLMTMELLDARIIHHLYRTLLNNEDRRDLFIFAGYSHIKNVCEYMKNLHCRSVCQFSSDSEQLFDFYYKGRSLSYKQSASDRLDDRRCMSYLRRLNDHWDQAGKLFQKIAQGFIDIYGVDITRYFELDNYLEKMDALEQEKVKREFIKTKTARHMVKAWQESIELT